MRRWTLLFAFAAVGSVVAVFHVLQASAVRRERASTTMANAPAAPSSPAPTEVPPAVSMSSDAPSPREVKTVTAPKAAPPASSAFPAAMVVTPDPETGRPALLENTGRALTIDEMQALARAEAEGLVTLKNPDGSETLNHEGRFASRSIVRVGKDGKVVHVCVHGEAAADHALHATPEAVPAAAEED